MKRRGGSALSWDAAEMEVVVVVIVIEVVVAAVIEVVVAAVIPDILAVLTSIFSTDQFLVDGRLLHLCHL